MWDVTGIRVSGSGLMWYGFYRSFPLKLNLGFTVSGWSDGILLQCLSAAAKVALFQKL